MRHMSKFKQYIMLIILSLSVSDTTCTPEENQSRRNIIEVTNTLAKKYNIEITNTLANKYQIEPIDISIAQSQEQQLLAIYAVQNKLLSIILASTIHELQDHLMYWKNQRFVNSVRYFLSKSPVRLFWGTKKEDEIKENITILEQELEFNAFYLGKLQSDLAVIQQTPTQQQLDLIIPSLYTISTCLEHKKVETLAPMSRDVQTAQNIATYNIQNIDRYKKHALQRIQDTAKPGHFTRYWLAYTISTITALASTYFIYKNIDNFPIWYAQGKNIADQWRTDLSKKVEELKNTLLRKNDYIAEPSIPSERREIKAKQYSNRLYKHYKRYFFDIADEEIELANKNALQKKVREPIPGEESRKISWLSNPLMPLFRKIDEIQLDIDLGDYALSSLGHSADQTLLSLRNLVENYLKLTIQLFAIMPAAGTTYLGGKLSWRLLNKLIPSKQIDAPVRNILRTVDRILNNQSTTQHYLNHTDQGFVLYWITQLRKYAYFMLPDQQIKFLEDIDDIASLKMTIQQKRNVIERMYRTYDFLVPISLLKPR